MALQQATRFLQITTPLGENAVLLTGFRGREELSRLFRFELDLISDNPGIAPPSIIGKPVTFSTATADEGVRRHFHGLVNRFYIGDVDQEQRRNYRMEVVPWLWFLTRTSDCRIFQNMKSPDIIQKIFSDLGFSDFTLKLKGQYRQREYCVQYRETDFNFVSRLMEEDGIYYYFQHEDGKHILVMADDAGGFVPCKQAKIDYPDDTSSIAIKEHLTSWEHQYEFRSGKWAQTDYNFETPRTALMTNSSSIVPFQESPKFEFYDYPGEYLTRGDGSPLTDVRMQEEETGHNVVQSSSTCYHLTPGCKFKVGHHRDSSEKGKGYAVTSIVHYSSEPMGYETGRGGGEADYSNTFICIPDSTKFRPARLTPKPIVQGIQTAVVVGPNGEEIYCDKYGRIKVQFYWDREGKKDENSSCWMRVACPHAGREWGNVSIPRIGQEVIVDFLEGDPDRPLVVGSVYNADQMPHYRLPDNKTRTYLKTNSSKGGDGYNELMFEDLKDNERVFIHAQKNMDVRVRNDSKTRIYGNKHQIVGWEKDGQKGGDQRELVWEDRHTNIKQHDITHIEGSVELAIGYGEASGGGNLDVMIEADHKELVGGNAHSTIDGDRVEKVGGAASETIGGDWNRKSGKNIAIESGAAGDIHLKAGMNVVIEAGMQLTLKGPGGFITIGPAGIAVQGMLVNINSGGAAGSGKGCQPQTPEKPKQAKPTKPEQAFDSKTGKKSCD